MSIRERFSMNLNAQITIKDLTLTMSMDDIEALKQLLDDVYGIVGQEASEIISTTRVASNGPFVKNKIERMFTTSRGTVVKIVVYET